MKRMILGVVLGLTLANAALAGGMSFDLPRLDFPLGSEEVTQTCNPLVQTCE
ncbi:hypothetical protein RYZ20_09925 [Thioclava sp. A2]|uniref:hypothetical protein n=1 Tax=Thioclava sp. FCG-A2 TaxID=3080562 RepID=UPI002953FCB9|nr:hypothetical protein [Thioclava sp. A2]MDV7271219.1 hypothetical protein [Thioclava sp. A2]